MAVNLSALSSNSEINAYIEMLAQQGEGILNPEVFYSTQLLDTIRDAEASYQYFRYAENAPIQGKADKLVLRRWAPLQGHTVPLSEGIPPKSDKGSVEKYEMSANSYGRYMEFTDKVSYKIVDPVIAHYTAEYAIVAVETLDLLAQETLLTSAQKHYAGLAANISKLTIANGTPKIADLRLIGLSLKKLRVKPRSNGKFHVLVSPEFVFDMIDDAYVKAYMTINQTTGQIYDNGALFPMFGFEFYEVNNCPESGLFYNGAAKRCLPVYTHDDALVLAVGDTDGGTVLTTGAATIGDAAAVGDIVGGVTISNIDTTNGITYGYIVETADPYDAVTNATGNWYNVSDYVKDARTGLDASYIPEQLIWRIPEDWTEFKVQHTIILGAEALTKTYLAGEDNVKTYVKPLGSTGVLDPIEQRQSIGFKINSVGFGSSRLEAIVDYINVPTQLNV